MAPTKQEIILQIANGKVQTALENLVQQTGQLQDKEMQQRCILLYSQLSQLKNSFGAGTIDNKTYQLELNRITEAALKAAQDLPATQHQQQYHTPPPYQQHGTYQQQSSSSGWKTWGILLTGAGGVVVLLIIVGLMMEQPATNSALPTTSFIEANPGGGAKSTPGSSSVTKPTEPAVTVNPYDKYVGTWEGAMNVGGMVIGGLHISLNSNNQYYSTFKNPYDGSLLAEDKGSWLISNNGLLSLNSVQGAKEVYNTQWDNSNRFAATMVDGPTPELIGAVVVFAKLNN